MRSLQAVESWSPGWRNHLLHSSQGVPVVGAIANAAAADPAAIVVVFATNSPGVIASQATKSNDAGGRKEYSQELAVADEVSDEVKKLKQVEVECPCRHSWG